MMFLAVLMCWLEASSTRSRRSIRCCWRPPRSAAPMPAFFPGRLSPTPCPFEFRVHLVFGMAGLQASLLWRCPRRAHRQGGEPACTPRRASAARSRSCRRSFRSSAWCSRSSPLLSRAYRPTLAFGIVYSGRPSSAGAHGASMHKTVFVVPRLILAALGWPALRLARAHRAALDTDRLVLLMLAYPGSRFVLEVLLHRA